MGLDLGLEKAGIEVLLASEIDPAARQTIQLNRPHLPLLGDVRDYTAPEIRSLAKLKANQDLDLVTSCYNVFVLLFSSFNKVKS